MRKLGVLLVGILVVGLVAGCIGGKSTSTTSTVAQTSTQATSTPQSRTMTSSTTSSITKISTTTTSPLSETMTPTKTQTEPKIYSREELLKNLRKIKQFTYLENVSVTLDIKIKQGNLTFNAGEVSITSKKVGYVDLVNKEADINTTTTTFPGGATTFTREIIKDGEIYLYSNGVWEKLTNESFVLPPDAVLNLTWEYNVVSFVEKYLQKEPFNKTIENGTQIFYYNITTEDLNQLARFFIGFKDTNMTFNVSNGILEVKFRDGHLIGGRIAYNMRIKILTKGPQGEIIEVIEAGREYEEFIVKDINVKKNVKKPISYKA
ncbi:MAG: hypothetical protein H0Z18_01710 [Thermococcus sp.]|uniref:hypothetical protein n=1 Tax=Thermococcus sp. TaxID=35749 RepID=UPI001D255EA3|nr:hypothetical protein [Thermococcus sp.]MBO8173954.1 hypothetical protein [Thermococcus sp.]